MLCPENIIGSPSGFQAVNRMEILLNRREQELLILQEKIATKESVSFFNLFLAILMQHMVHLINFTRTLRIVLLFFLPGVHPASFYVNDVLFEALITF